MGQILFFKVIRDTKHNPDQPEDFLSPTVMCGPHGLKFQKPVELTLPHSGSLAQNGWEDRKNSNYDGNTATIMIDHF